MKPKITFIEMKIYDLYQGYVEHGNSLDGQILS